jgi:DNA-binding NtrC family response regulator
MAHDILIVDDEADIRMLITGVLKDEGYATREAADTAQTLAAIQARQPTLVILDIWLQGSGLEGIEILKQLHVEMPSVPAVMISGHGTIETAVEAIKIGAYDFLENRSNRSVAAGRGAGDRGGPAAARERGVEAPRGRRPRPRRHLASGKPAAAAN